MFPHALHVTHHQLAALGSIVCLHAAPCPVAKLTYIRTILSTGGSTSGFSPHLTQPCMQVETLYVGGSKISIRTSALDDKANACNMLCCYADELREGFFPWVEQVPPSFSQSRRADRLVGE